MIDLLLLYVFAFFSALLHEIMHFIMALIFHIPIVNVKIGSDWPQLKIGKFLISPCLGISYVTTEYEPVLLLPKIKKVIYFISGIIINLFLSCIFLTVYHYTNQYLMLFDKLLHNHHDGYKHYKNISHHTKLHYQLVVYHNSHQEIKDNQHYQYLHN